MRIEKQLKDVENELGQVKNAIGRGGVNYVAQVGYVNIAIGNVYCTFYITTVVSTTALAFVGVIIFVCYVLY